MQAVEHVSQHQLNFERFTPTESIAKKINKLHTTIFRYFFVTQPPSGVFFLGWPNSIYYGGKNYHRQLSSLFTHLGKRFDQNTKIVPVTVTEKWSRNIILTPILELPGVPHYIDCFYRYITATCGLTFFAGVLRASQRIMKTFFGSKWTIWC